MRWPTMSLFFLAIPFLSATHGSDADLAKLQAKVRAAQAEVQAAQATLQEAQARWARGKDLFARKAIAAQELDSIEKTLKRTQADLAVKELALVQARQDLERHGHHALAGRKLIRVASPVAGIVVMPDKERRLAPGDRVKKGDLLLRLDDRLAALDMDMKKTHVLAAEGEMKATAAALRAAQVTLNRHKELFKQGTIGQETVEAAQATVERYRAEVDAKKARLQTTHVELERARVVAEMHSLRSPVDGVVHAVHKTLGEGVQALETVVVIQVDTPKK